MEYLRYLRATIHQVTCKDDTTPLRMCDLIGWNIIFTESNLVTKSQQKFLQFIEAAMDIADDIEGTMLVPEITPDACALKLYGSNLFGRIQDVDVMEALIFEASQRFTELHSLIAYNMRAKIAILGASDCAHSKCCSAG